MSTLPPTNLLDAVAQPVLLIDGDARVRHANPALARLLGREADAVHDRPVAECFESGPGQDAGHGRLHAAGGTPIPVRWAAQAVAGSPGLRLVTLTDLRDEQALRERMDHVASVLDLVQDFGRIGLWERRLSDMKGWWDRHMFRFWGLPPGEDAPDFDQAVHAVLPEDQPLLRAAFERSWQQPGPHDCHYRVRGADGVTRALHSQWQVLADPQGQPSRALGVVSDDTEADARARRADEASAQLTLAADLADVAVWRHDLRTNCIHYSDKAWSVLDMPPRTEPLSLDEVRALIHPEDMPHVVASAEQALKSDGPVDMRARYRSRKRGWRDVLTRRVVQRDAEGRAIAFLGVALDVTDQVERQRREQDLSRRLELAGSAAGVGIWSLDVATGEVHWNEQMRVLHELPHGPPPNTLSAYAERYVPPEHHAMLKESVHRLAQQGHGDIDIDVPILRADGQQRRISMRTRVQRMPQGLRYVGVMLDVTERRAAEQALRQAHERLTLATRGAGLGTWEHDPRTGRGWWDEQMWRLRGLPPQGDESPDVDGRMALIHEADRDSVRREHEAANAQHQPTSIEFRVRLPDGRVRWLASRSVPILDDDGRLQRRIGVNWDITDSREAEAARQAELSAQRESQAKSQLLARMSHELRTPLNAVIGFTQLLQADDPRVDAATRRRQLDHIRMAGEHLLALIDDVLDLSSLESSELRLDPTSLPLKPLVQSTLPMVQELSAQRGVAVHYDSLDGVVRADATRLRQVLINLLSNAIKYNRPGGEVQLASEVGVDHVVLRVIDNGPGLTRDQLRHLFEPFNRLGAERSGVQGTGIGLAIVKATVERMGGSVRVQSRVGTGTRVEVRLPRGDKGGNPAPAPPLPPAASPPPTEAPLARVLYIEDNPVNTMIVREIVARRPGLALQTAVAGLEGVAAAVADPPRLVLVDMQLPDIDGLEVLRRLQADERTRQVPCIALSANAMPEDIERALGAGFTDYWTKPLDVRGFLAALDRLLG